jgi:hypothetical protein
MTRAAVATLATAATAFALPASASALALSVTTGSPQDVSATRATMRATVSVSALGASVSWQYGTTTAYGATSATVSSGLLAVDQTLTVGVTGLAPDTTYHVRAVATSGLSTSYGRDVKFNTNGNSGSSSSGDAPATDGSPAPTGDSSTTAPTTSTTTTVPTAAAKGPQPAASTSKGPQPTTIPADDSTGAIPTDDASTVAPGLATAAVTPVLGKSFGAATVQGTVTATSPSGSPVDLGAARSIPTGTLIDARAGTVELKTALDGKGATQTGHFWGAVFDVRQSAGARGLTQLTLRGVDFSSCKTVSKAVARAAAKATKKKKKKKTPASSLWGSDDHGRFQTRGRGSVATVRGTHWLTQDTCDGTLTRVLAGAVSVRDLRRDRTVVVTHGHQYLARMTS